MSRGDGVDTRSDIYSLGILLYELLVSAPAFNPDTLRSADHEEIVRIIKEEVPPKPSTRLTRIESTSINPTHHPITASTLRGELDVFVHEPTAPLLALPSHLAKSALCYSPDGDRLLRKAKSNWSISQLVGRNL